jgi:hypothetical protein
MLTKVTLELDGMQLACLQHGMKMGIFHMQMANSSFQEQVDKQVADSEPDRNADAFRMTKPSIVG